ncbi:MAG: tail fiber domain-containing protein [Bdellovibrionaceae bacterium]|nr:tail fiber domain-containing protein [Pseudobdellovibrionaceae bacterium]
MNSNSVQFRLQVRTPGPEDCLMFEEIQVVDMSKSQGTFSLSLNDGSGFRQDSYTWNLFDVFSNRRSFSFIGSDCTGPTVYTPNPADSRRFRVLFNDGTFPIGTWEPLPAQTINYVPMSIETYSVGGFPASSLLRVENGGNLVNTSPLSNSQYAELLALTAGTSGLYAKPGELAGSALPAVTDGQSIRWNSGSWQAYTPAEIDPTGNITSTNSIVTGTTTTGSLHSRGISLFDSDNSNYIRFLAPPTGDLTASYNLILPSTAGGPNQLLGMNNAGTALENKSVIAGTGVTVNHSAGGIEVSAPGATLWAENSGDIFRSSGNVGIGTTSPTEPLYVVGNIESTGYVTATSFIATSDQRLKTNINRLNGLEIVKKINGYRYDWKSGKGSDYGVLAQEVERVAPELVENEAYQGKFKAVRYNGLIAALIEAVKTLDARTDEVSILKEEVRELQKQNQELNDKINRIMKRLEENQ